MGSLTWHGWQTSLEDVIGTPGILYGGNLRQRPKDDEQKETNVTRQTDQPVLPRIKSKIKKKTFSEQKSPNSLMGTKSKVVR